MLGDYAWNMPFATIEMRDRTAIPNDVAALPGRRFVSASETNDGTRLNEARVKALTGCDPLTARFLHGEFFTFEPVGKFWLSEPVGKFWLSVNHKPDELHAAHVRERRYRERLAELTAERSGSDGARQHPDHGGHLRALGAGRESRRG